jgi:bifunctional enzyme CysN/CysC
VSDGTVVWLTGLPGAGKSTLATRIQERLGGRSSGAVVLDGDEVRAALGLPAGRGPSERDAFYAALAALASLLARQGLTVIVAATANRAVHRERARSLAPSFVEVHVATPAAECERRDSKGLYAAARAGRATGVPGVDAPYETPSRPDVVASGGEDVTAVERAVELVAVRGAEANDPTRGR